MTNFRFKAEVSDQLQRRSKIFIIIATVAFVFLGMRLWYLQVLQEASFVELSDGNRLRRVSLPPFRGKIQDRNGEPLVDVRPSFNLYIIPEDVQDLDTTLNFLAKKIKVDRKRIVSDIKQTARFKRVLVRADIDKNQVAFVEENKLKLPGVRLHVEPLRNYVHDRMAAHILGYLGEISKENLEKRPEDDYAQGDLVGKNGVESVHENWLKGRKGFKEVEVDVAGRELRVLRNIPPTQGNNLQLSLDYRIQKVLEEAMKPKKPGDPFAGSAVFMRVDTGEIIAMTSKPEFDPNLFAAGISRRNWRNLLFNETHPLQHRAIDGQYPPGSTYKIVTAYAALKENLVTPETTIYCPGYFRLGRGRYRCWKRYGHGHVNIHDAIVQSCDVYFYTVGNRMGIDTLAKYAKLFGLGRFSQIGLQGEKPGLIPTTQWKLLAKNQPWLLGETISASIGQGYNMVTPLQQANMVSVVANGGTLFRPWLVKKVFGPDGKIIKEFKPKTLSKNQLDKNLLALIRDGMLGVVNERRGTGWRAKMKDVQVSGKTGTAQVVRIRSGDENLKEDEIPFKFRDHAWFVGFAPYEKPEIAFAVLVEHGGHGGAAAAPIAKKVIQAYFQDEKKIINSEESNS